MKKPSRVKYANTLWSTRIKEKYNHCCAFCGETFAIAGHHIRSRRFASTRYDTDNGIAVCRKHHWMAHNDPEAFRQELKMLIGEKMINHLFKKSQKIVKTDKEYLERNIKILEKEGL